MASADYLSFSMDAMTGSPHTSGDGHDLKCVIKNTFLELVTDAEPPTEHPGSRRRASSDSHVSLKYLQRQPTSGCGEEVYSDSTPSIVNDDGSLYSLTPRSPSKLTERGEGEIVMEAKDVGFQVPLPGLLPFQVPSAGYSYRQDHHEEHQKHHVPVEVLDVLGKLTQLVGDEHWKREDLANHAATPILYPHIPLDEEGSITSLGSILHFEGTCKPCAFLKKDRCHKKDLCLYCHFGHEVDVPKPARFRKSKKKRMRQAKQNSNDAQDNEQYYYQHEDDVFQHYGERVSL